MFYLILALAPVIFINLISGFLDSIPAGSYIGDIFLGVLHLEIIFYLFLILGLFWVALAIGLFLNQGWAVILTKIMAILSLLGSILSCNCIGIIVAIIILYLVKSDRMDDYDRPIKRSKPQRHCPGCGRNIPFNAKSCQYCGKQFNTYHNEKKYAKQNVTSQKVYDMKKSKKDISKRTIYCPECGTQMKGNARFCPECGKNLEKI